MPVKSAGKQGQLELECGPNRHKTHLLFRYFFYLSSCFQTENLPWPDCQSRFLHKLTRFSLYRFIPRREICRLAIFRRISQSGSGLPRPISGYKDPTYPCSQAAPFTTWTALLGSFFVSGVREVHFSGLLPSKVLLCRR